MSDWIDELLADEASAEQDAAAAVELAGLMEDRERTGLDGSNTGWVLSVG